MKKILLAVLWLTGVAPALAQGPAADGPQVRPIAPFHAITVGTGIELLLTPGHAQRVEVSAATTDFRDHILTTVAAGVLSIHYENPDDRGSYDSQRRERPNKLLRVAVTADQLTALTAGSGARVRAAGNFAAPDFQLDVSSGARCEATDLAVGVLVVRQSSGSTVVLSGRAPRFDLRVVSGSTFSGEKLQADRGQIEASNGSTVRLAVREALLAEANSGASIHYLGSPEVTKEVTGGGSVGK